MTTSKSNTSGSSHKNPAKAKAPVAAKRIVQRPRARKITSVTAEQRLCDIAVAAYYIAERRGFSAGDPLADWVQAEAEIDCLLAAKPRGQLS
jgi:hypothetical protein